ALTTLALPSSVSIAASIVWGDGACANAGVTSSTIAAIDNFQPDNFQPNNFQPMSASSAQTNVPKPAGKPVRQLPVDDAAEINIGRLHLSLRQHQQHAETVGEPQMRIGHAAQLVVIVLDRLVVG